MNTKTPESVLSERIWFTRKAWINAEERLLRNEFHTQLLLVVYSAYTTSLAVVLLAYEPTPINKKLVDTALAVLSVIILALSLYLNSKSFKDRAARFKNGYHDLQEIENELLTVALLDSASEKKIACDNCSKRYSKALRDVENHNELDDIRARVIAGAGLTSRTPNRTEKINYWYWRIWRLCGLIIMYCAPLLALIAYFTKT